MLIGRSTIGTVGYMGGVPSVPEPFAKAWGDMIAYNGEYLTTQAQRIHYTRATVSYHSLARDSLVEQMMGEWLLQLDTDVLFDPDIVAHMLHKMEVHNIDVLVGIYPYKGQVNAPVLYGYNPKTRRRFVIGDWDRRADVIRCDGAGAGCLMVRKSVFDKIKKTGQSPFAIMEPFSEDNSFFMRCRKLRIPAYFSPNIRLRHIRFDEMSIEKDFPKEKRIVKREMTVNAFK